MWRRTEKAHYAVFLGLILAIFLIFSLFPSTRWVSVTAQTGVAIDLYTNQAPFDGKGANQSADAYEPQELAVLFALATYNDAPVAGKLVAFQINGPTNQFQNITVVGSGTTDENGIAEFSFRLPWPSQTPEKAIFGQWIALATVEIAERVVIDTLIFRVGWILSIIDIVTLNPELSPQSIFARQDPIVFNLTVQNTAKTEKSAIIRVEVKDSDQHPIIYIQMESRVFQPGNSNVKATSQIPPSAETGLANVSAAPFTAPPDLGGKLYSPAIYTTFTISGGGIDIAITSVALSSNQVLSGEIVNIGVTVLNEGNQSETFDVSVYYNSTWIATSQVIQLTPSTQKTIAFIWNTSSVSNGIYQISASAPLAGDQTPSDNTFLDGFVEVVSEKPPPSDHDISVTNVAPSPTVVKAGQIVTINVTVRNNGRDNESFYVKVYYGRVLIDRKLVQNLAPSTEALVVFKWNTSGVFPLKYVITAVAETVEGETHVADNTFVDGTVTILPYPPFFPTLDWLILWIIIIVAAVMGIVLLFLVLSLDRIRRRKRSRVTYTVIAHPHI
jgi:hypothetical protein